MDIESIIYEIQKRVGVALSISADKRCSLLVDDRYTITLEQVSSTSEIYLYSILGKVSAAHQAQILAILMEANLFGLQSHRAVFSFYPQDQTIILHYCCDAEKIDYIEFENIFLQFTHSVKEWTEKLQMLIDKAPKQPEDISLLRRQAMFQSKGKQPMIFM